MAAAALLLAVLALAGTAAAYDCPGGVKGADQVTGYSPFYGAAPDLPPPPPPPSRLGLPLPFGLGGRRPPGPAPKPVKYADQVPAWKKFGAISQISLHYSWKQRCLFGIKAVYGPGGAGAGAEAAGSVQLLGIEENLTEKLLALLPGEAVTKVELREGGASGCISWIKLHTNKNNAVALGAEPEAPADPDSSSDTGSSGADGEYSEGGGSGDDEEDAGVKMSVINRKGGFLAALRGYEEFTPGAPPGKGPLQQLQLVWGVGFCPERALGPAAPSDLPPPPPPPPPSRWRRATSEKKGGGAGGGAAPAAGGGAAAGGGSPTLLLESAQVAETPAVEALVVAEATCPQVKAQCDTSAKAGSVPSCPALPPYTAPACKGGCCVSSGKCKSGFCGRVGLGGEVVYPDMLCWSTNSGVLAAGAINKCRNLACKLSVPGCVTESVLSGSCVGSVVALSADIDPAARGWLGMPCLQGVPGGLPVNALGKVDLNGAYAAKLWSVCNCSGKNATKAPSAQTVTVASLPESSASSSGSSGAGAGAAPCKGPMCAVRLPAITFPGRVRAAAVEPSKGAVDLSALVPDLSRAAAAAASGGGEVSGGDSGSGSSERSSSSGATGSGSGGESSGGGEGQDQATAVAAAAAQGQQQSQRTWLSAFSRRSAPAATG